MGDFYQNGIVTTLHNLVRRPVEDIEADLLQFRKARPMSLVLPSLYSELEGPALKHIVQELAKVPYLEEIVIGLDRADEAQYRHALEYFSELPQPFKNMGVCGPSTSSFASRAWPQLKWVRGGMSGIASVMSWPPG